MSASALAVPGGPVVAPQALVTFNEVFRLVVVQRLGNTITIMNAFHFGREGTGGSANTLVTDFRDNILTTWRAQVVGGHVFTEIYAYQTQPVMGDIASVSPNLAGTNGSSTAIPSVAAGIVTWRTQLPGRRHRGRSYFASLPWGITWNATGGHWTAAGLTILNTLGSAILNRYTQGANPGGFVLCVWSRKGYEDNPSGDWRANAVQVTRYTSQPYLGSMGTRRGNRGI